MRWPMALRPFPAPTSRFSDSLESESSLATHFQRAFAADRMESYRAEITAGPEISGRCAGGLVCIKCGGISIPMRQVSLAIKHNVNACAIVGIDIHRQPIAMSVLKIPGPHKRRISWIICREPIHLLQAAVSTELWLRNTAYDRGPMGIVIGRSVLPAVRVKSTSSWLTTQLITTGITIWQPGPGWLAISVRSRDQFPATTILPLVSTNRRTSMGCPGSGDSRPRERPIRLEPLPAPRSAAGPYLPPGPPSRTHTCDTNKRPAIALAHTMDSTRRPDVYWPRPTRNWPI